MLNQVYANVLGKPVIVPGQDVTSLGAAIFAFLAAGTFRSVEEAQNAVCPAYRIFEPDLSAITVYQDLFACYRMLYFAMGSVGAGAASIGDVLPTLRRISADAQKTGAASA